MQYRKMTDKNAGTYSTRDQSNWQKIMNRSKSRTSTGTEPLTNDVDEDDDDNM